MPFWSMVKRYRTTTKLKFCLYFMLHILHHLETLNQNVLFMSCTPLWRLKKRHSEMFLTSWRFWVLGEVLLNYSLVVCASNNEFWLGLMVIKRIELRGCLYVYKQRTLWVEKFLWGYQVCRIYFLDFTRVY